MKQGQWNSGDRNPLFNQRGLCLSELIIATAVGTVVLAGSLEALNLVHAQAVQQQRSMAGQQDMRLGLEVLEQEVRMSSASAITTAASDRLEFSANIHALETTTTATVASGQTVVPVQDGGGWGQGKSVRICGASGCESHRLARTGQRLQLTSQRGQKLRRHAVEAPSQSSCDVPGDELLAFLVRPQKLDCRQPLGAGCLQPVQNCINSCLLRRREFGQCGIKMIQDRSKSVIGVV